MNTNCSASHVKHRLLTAFALLVCSCAPAFAHHSTAAVYDQKRPVTLKGIVTKFDWTNPHVFLAVEALEANGNATSWTIELPSRIELKRDGWTKDSVAIGEAVTVEASLARDGSKQAYGKTVILASGKKLNAAAAPFLKVSEPSKPAPHWPDGHVRLGRVPGETGYWSSTATSMMKEEGSSARVDSEGLLANIADAGKVAPFQPWSWRSEAISGSLWNSDPGATGKAARLRHVRWR
jgi:hypothetical protein